jgi:hypothetical protein
MRVFYTLFFLAASSINATELPPIPAPLDKEPFFIQPPDAPSSNMETLGRQLLLHNTNRAIERLKRNDPSLGRTITNVESLAKVAPPPIVVDNFKLTTGLQVDKGIAFSEVTFYSPTVRSEVNALHKNTTVKLTDGRFSSTYTREFDSRYNLMLVFSTTFE